MRRFALPEPLTYLLSKIPKPTRRDFFGVTAFFFSLFLRHNKDTNPSIFHPIPLNRSQNTPPRPKKAENNPEIAHPIVLP